MNEKLEKLNQEIEETEKKLRWAQQEEKRRKCLISHRLSSDRQK